MKSKLLATALGLATLGTSALALADNHRGHDRSYPGRPAIVRPPHGPAHYWSQPRPPVIVHQHWRGPVWRAPYYHHYGYAPRPYARYDDGVTIIFKGRID
jgi:hypothetical protein